MQWNMFVCALSDEEIQSLESALDFVKEAKKTSAAVILSEEEKDHLRNRNRIFAIKSVKERTGLSLALSKRVIDRFWNEKKQCAKGIDG